MHTDKLDGDRMKGDRTIMQPARILKQGAPVLSLVAESGNIHLSEGYAERGGDLFTRISLEQRVDPDNGGGHHDRERTGL